MIKKPPLKKQWKQTAAKRAKLARAAMTSRHAKRMLTGRAESSPAELVREITDERIREREARRAVEDRMLARELGVTLDDLV